MNTEEKVVVTVWCVLFFLRNFFSITFLPLKMGKILKKPPSNVKSSTNGAKSETLRLDLKCKMSQINV